MPCSPLPTLLACTLVLGACARGLDAPVPADAGRATVPVYVVGHGWHAGIALRRADVEGWPEALTAFPEARYLEVGWGDAAYYRDPDPGLAVTLRAGLWPTPSVLHVAGFRRPPTRVFPRSQVVRLMLTPEQRDELLAFVRAEYARGAQGHPLPVGPGLYGDGRFYRGRTAYHVFNNCNHWVARALRAAGQPVRRALTVGALMRQVREVGEVVQEGEA